MEEKTKNTWKSLCESLGARRGIEDSLRILDEGYGSPSRHYHGWKHIEACLAELDASLDSDGASPQTPPQGGTQPWLRPRILEAAIWFHDLVYDPRREDNEERSADLLLELGDRMAWPREASEAAARLVLATRHFTAPVPASIPEDCTLIRDIDLAILGRDWESFEAYEHGIRLEYAFVPESEYREKRSLVLRSFLDRRAIFGSPRFVGLYEARARENIARLAASLS